VDRRIVRDSSVIDQHVQLSIFLLDFFSKGINAFGLGDVELLVQDLGISSTMNVEIGTGSRSRDDNGRWREFGELLDDCFSDTAGL